MKLLSIVSGAALAVLGASSANASIILHIDETFASGATVVGTVTAADNYSAFTAVDATLSGGGYGTDHLNWIWDPSTNFNNNGGSVYGNFLMDGSISGGYTYFDTISINYSNPSHPVFDTTGSTLSASGGNNINYSDAFVSGSISSVPETSTWLMMLAGFAGLGFLGYRRNATARA
jgi:hypothetical protein